MNEKFRYGRTAKTNPGEFQSLEEHDSPTSDIPSLGSNLTEGEEKEEEEQAVCDCIKVSGVHFSQGVGGGETLSQYMIQTSRHAIR